MSRLNIHRIIIVVLLGVIALLYLRPSRPSADNTIGSLADREEYLDSPWYPIKFNRELNEYHLVYDITNADGSVSKEHAILHYDPFSGVRLPESKRDDLFVPLDDTESDRIQSQLRDVRTLAGVRGLLGNPDLGYGPFEGVRTQWTYFNLMKTLDIVVQESTNGQLSVCYLRKKKGTN